MLPSDAQSPLGLPVRPTRAHYLSATDEAPQPFCGNAEGWGPLSPIRYDLTPCFLDIWISAVAAYGTVLGIGALIYLIRRCKPQPVVKNWQFYTKLVSTFLVLQISYIDLYKAILALLFATTAGQAICQIIFLPNVWYRDFRFWTTIITLLSLLVVAAIEYFEHWRSRTPNGVVLTYWLFFLMAYTVKLRSLVAQHLYEDSVAYFVIFCLSFSLAVTEFALEWLVPKKLSPYEALGDADECPYNYATVFSVLSFSWMTPMMKFGYNHFVTQEDLWNLRDRDTTRSTTAAFDDAWDRQLEKKKPSLWFTLFRGFGGPYFRGSVFKTLSDCLAFVQPQLLRLLISFVQSYKTDNPLPLIRGVAIALAMFAVSISQTVCLHQYFQRSFETGMRVKSALTAAVYSKTMRLSNEGRASKSSGDIVNLMAIDTMRLQDLCQFGQMLWSAPLQIVLCMASLYQLVGISMLAGIGVMVLMIPLNGVLANIMKSLQKTQMKNKDARTRLMTEILNNMKSIKLYAWTAAFMNKLDWVRNEQELKTLRKIGATQAVSTFAWSTTPFLVSCSTFMVFVLTSKQPLSTDIVFPALTLFNLLTFPLTVLPMVITSIVEASVAVNRLTEFFTAEELQRDAVNVKPSPDNIGDESVRIRGGTFTWDKNDGRYALEDIDFVARKGQLSCVVGRVGAGKSTLLQSLLGDVWKVKGEVIVRGAVAYVAQSSWVMNASVKENIIFGHRWDPTFYDETVKACALIEDFASLPDGDSTEVGERGISLSGGQKARLTLARAVYARADIYLLDDCLSAVDQHVGRHLINQVFGPQGLLKSKTRILATNSIPVLHEANYVLLLKAGRIAESGTYKELIATKGGEINNLIRTAQNEEVEERETPEEKVEMSNGTMTAEPEDFKEEVEALMDEDEIEETREGLADLQPIKVGQRGGVNRKESSLTLRRASTASFHGPRGQTNDEEVGVRTRQTKENAEQGKVKWNVYGEYAKANNLVAVGIYLATLLLAQTAQVGSSVWLKDWSEANGTSGRNDNIAYFIGIYFAFGTGSAFLVVCQTLIMWLLCSIEASKKLHAKMAIAIFRSPMSFFETTPTGRILNRFSADIYKVDEILARTFNMLFVNSARALFTLVVISASTPIFIALILPLGALYLYIQKYYLRTSRELKRLDSISRSPIYAHFSESLNGISTIRAYRQQRRFAMENEWRVDANVRAYFPSVSANRWLAVRLEFLGSIIILSAAVFAIVSVASGSGLSAGLVGLSMSYALQITQSLNWIVRQTVEVETNIVSVERVLEYARLPSEAPEVITENRPPISWPAHGAVAFNDFSTRYRPGLDLILKNINIAIKAREKIGVVGRTGAGKSSLTLALFRIIEPAEGFVSIDELNTSNIGLLDLRRRLAIIPQDAALFEGTVRDNLDPAHVHDDSELWEVLEHARLREHVEGMNGELEARINEGGSNLSQGQRQLISISRALLTPSNILVLDEATAAVDVETDKFLQRSMKGIFQDRTIITIAHRINTILDSDRILVLEKGRVAEFDSPSRLVEQRGFFYELVREAGLLESVPTRQQ